MLSAIISALYIQVGGHVLEHHSIAKWNMHYHRLSSTGLIGLCENENCSSILSVDNHSQHNTMYVAGSTCTLYV